ncbi:helix-turn-helix domain-containing protein [Bradyrhizobium canariense]|uniref:helix-turn-helix domain-containing protein n=1 Tax=Bradyrhizobium canariense TaxID=255045 RepID=UPI00142F69B1|nr:helix-turn-helix domain-containing protein [Bradyrhizobium canariense]
MAARTLYAAIRDGDLKARKFRRRTVILHEDLMIFLKNLPEVGVQTAVTTVEVSKN